MADHSSRRDAAPTIVEFINARLDEHEAVAHKLRRFLDDLRAAEPDRAGAVPLGNDPDWMLADIGSKRRLVSMFSPKFGQDVEDELAKGNDLPWMGQRALVELAAVYAGHPDCRKEWAVE